MPTDLRDQLQATLTGTHTVERELGGGGMSRVFVAEEQRLKRKVVVKVLSPELAQGISAERFEREIQVAASLQQANIVPLLTAGDTNGLPFYTMPFVEGQSLRSRLARGDALSITEIVGVLRDVARALAFAHERGVIHRDIKPDNVLLSGGTAVVTDFGIAKALSASRKDREGETLTQLGTSIGTPAYMSPEQAAGDPDIDHRADIYAFGCMAYELLAGRPPFHGRTPQRVLAAHMAETPQPVSELRLDTPPSLAELVMRCLAKDPSARPQSASELVRVLDTVTSSGTMPVMPAILLGGRGMLKKAVAIYAAAFIAVAIVAKAAILVIGLPNWVFPAALIVMALGLPAILFTAYVQRVTRQALTVTPTFTPGGTPSMAGGTMATLALKASPVVSWRRTAVSGAWAMAIFVVLVAAYMLMRVLGIGPAGSLLAAGKLNAQDPILIADFVVKGPDSSLSAGLTEALRTKLEESSAIRVFPPSGVADGLQQMRLAPDSRLTLPVAKELAQRQGIKAIVVADADPLGGGGFLVTVKLVNAATLDPIGGSQQETAANEGDLLKAVDGVTRELRGKIGESLKSVHADPPLEQVTTSSLAALAKYTEAAHANDVDNDFPKAVALLQEAIALDSTFGIAYRKLYVALGNAGGDVALQRAAIEHAYLLRDHMSPRERAIVEGSYYDVRPYTDRAKAYAAYLEALRLDPRSFPAANHLGALAMSRRDPGEAERLARIEVEGLPTGFGVDDLIQALVSQGKVEEASRWLDTLHARFPTGPLNPDEAAAVLAAGLRYDSLRKLVTPMLASPNPTQREDAVNIYTLLETMAGRIANARRMLDTAAALFGRRARADSLELFVQDATMRAWFNVDRAGGLALADRISSPAYFDGMSVYDRPYLTIATVYARAGDASRARALLTRHDAEMRDTAVSRQDQPDHHTALAEIALAEHKPADAMREFKLADVDPSDGKPVECAICLDFNLGRAYDLAEQPDSAIAAFERYLHRPYYHRILYDNLALPLVFRRLGALYEAKGDLAKAATYDRQFVDLWKNADPELQPQVDSVRKRLARLGKAGGG